MSPQSTINDINLQPALLAYLFLNQEEGERERQRDGSNEKNEKETCHKQCHKRRQEVCPWSLGLPEAVTVPDPTGSSQTLSKLLGRPQTLLKIPLQGSKWPTKSQQQ